MFSTDAAPAIRRIQTRSFLRAVRAHPRQAALLDRIGTNLDLSRLDSGFDFGWLSLEDHECATGPALAMLGRDGYLELWTETFLHSLQQPFLQAFTDLMTQLSSVSLIPLARRSPRVYDHLTRGCGTLRWTPDAQGGHLTLEHFPTEYDFDAWALSNLGSLQAGALQLGHPPQAVVLVQIDAGRRIASYRVREG